MSGGDEALLATLHRLMVTLEHAEYASSTLRKKLEAYREELFAFVRIYGETREEALASVEESGAPLGWEERVLALIIGRGRDWPVERLAEAVGVVRQTLYKNPRVKAALQARRAPGGALAEGSVGGERRRDA